MFQEINHQLKHEQESFDHTSHDFSTFANFHNAILFFFKAKQTTEHRKAHVEEEESNQYAHSLDMLTFALKVSAYQETLKN